jgi:hypothetical protein
MKRAKNARYKLSGGHRMVKVPRWKGNSGMSYRDVRGRVHLPQERIYYGTRNFWSYICGNEDRYIACIGYGLYSNL